MTKNNQNKPQISIFQPLGNNATPPATALDSDEESDSDCESDANSDID